MPLVIVTLISLSLSYLSLSLFFSLSFSLSLAQRPVEPEGLLTAESFEWLTVEQTYILVYLVSARVF